MTEAVQNIASLITRYHIFEQLYLRNNIVTKIKDQLSDALVKLYTAILKYLSKARRYYDQSTTSMLKFCPIV